MRWARSPRIVVQCAPRAPNGPDHLGLCVPQELDHHGSRYEMVDRYMAAVRLESAEEILKHEDEWEDEKGQVAAGCTQR